MAQRGINIPDTRDFSAFKPSMRPIPARVEAALAKSVQIGRDLPFAGAAKLIAPEGDGVTDAVIRNADGVLVVACLTEMPGVTPEMWDWWFGWHAIASERYLLWHPRDHVSTSLSAKRPPSKDLRARYLGLTSYITERFGVGAVENLSVQFRDPRDLGLDPAAVDAAGTAICFRGGAPDKHVETAYAVHFVRRVPGGSEMRSRFWLGHLRSRLPVVGPLLTLALNTAAVRRKMLPDSFGLNLLRHCSEEMGHLARILPALYERFKDE